MGNCIFLQGSLSKYHKRLYKIPRHVAVNISTRTWRDISTYVSRPRHVRVEVNLTLFLGKCKELFDQQAKAPDHF